METVTRNRVKHHTILFKSYYVVWKPQVGCEDKMSSRSLNRTM